MENKNFKAKSKACLGNRTGENYNKHKREGS